MKKIYFIIWIFCCLPWNGIGQNMLSSKDMVAITPAVSSELDLPENARKALKQKLMQVVTQNGFGSTSGDLFLTANVIVTDKQVTATVPAQFVISLDVSFYLLNLQEKVILEEMTLQLKGIDKLENKSILQAINNLNPRSPTIRNFMKQCRTKVIDYYTTRIPALLSKARSLADRMDYAGALDVLATIPECLDEYSAVAELMVSIYVQEIDKKAAAAIQKANAQMAVKNYIAALNALLAVDASSTHFDEATKMIESIKQQLDAEAKAKAEAELAKHEAELAKRKAELAAQQKIHDDKVMLEKMRIKAAKEESLARIQAYADSERMDKLLVAWYLGQFR